jgi:hypothetical protein
MRVNVLMLYKAACFDFQEVIIRPFSERKGKITVLVCTWNPNITRVVETNVILG